MLTLLMCAWLLLTPLLKGDWRVQLLLEAFMLVTVLVTVWANPQLSRLRNVLIVLWLASVAGTLLWASNSSTDVFIDTTSNDYFVLLSGRWFRAAGTRARRQPERCV